MAITRIKGKLVGIEIPPVGAMRITMEVYQNDVYLVKDLIVGAEVETEQGMPI